MYKYEPPKKVFFDLETTVNPDHIALMPEPAAPANLKDPAKIEAAIAEKKADMVSNAPLDPDYGKILCICYSESTNGKDGAMSAIVSPDETAMIATFWQVLADNGGRCVGYNVIGFDLPYLLRRSFALGIRPAVIPNLARFRTDPVTDLMQILYNWDSYKCKGLKTVAKLYGIPNAAEGVSGADVAGMPLEDVVRYCMSDVKLTMDLYRKMNGVYFSL